MIRIYHAYRNNFEKNLYIFEKHKNIKISISKDLTLLSVMNKDCYDKSYLVTQCKNNNIDLVVPVSTFNVKNEDWKNTMKISAIVQALETIDTKYVLILDGKDTCILNDLDDEFLKEFEKMECDILFNMQKLPMPNIKFKDWKYPINAGVCVGKREALLSFYDECEKVNAKNEYILKNGMPSEQFIIRKTANDSPLIIKTDYKMVLLTCYSEFLK
jgi:hypothetical protein